MLDKIELKEINRKNIESKNFFNNSSIGDYFIVVACCNEKAFKSISISKVNPEINSELIENIKDAIIMVEKIGELNIFIPDLIFEKILRKHHDEFYYDNFGNYFFKFLNTKITIF
jgi:hypothetical protein